MQAIEQQFADMKILLADDHDLFRHGLEHMAQQLAEQVVVLQANNWNAAIEMVSALPELDLALVDLNMPGMDAFEGLSRLLAIANMVPVVVISASESPVDMKRVLAAGAMGYVMKSEPMPVMLSALRLVLSGGVYVPPRMVSLSGNSANGENALPFGLTPRQYEVLNVLLEGKSNKEIARELNLSDITVKSHIGAIFKALNVSSRAEAMLKAGQLKG